MKKRILGALATLALSAVAFGPDVEAQSSDGPNPDPIGDLIETIDLEDTANPERAEGGLWVSAPATVAEGSAAAPPTGEPDWRFRATLYHSGAGGVGTRDATGCRVVPMRTAAVDRRLVGRRAVVFIRETVGIVMPDGRPHDGYWYASDTGGAIRGNRIDLYTGMNRASMRPIMRLSTATVTVTRVGTFEGCPTAAAPQLAAVGLRETVAARVD